MSVANELVSIISLVPVALLLLSRRRWPDYARPVFIILGSLSLIAHAPT